MNIRARRKISYKLIAVILAGILVVGMTGYGLLHYREWQNRAEHATTFAMSREVFPTYASGELSSSQQKLVSLIETEYRAQAAGRKYSQVVEEPWCADFVSWIERENGTPFVNPNSGSWRIPGTHTLRDYFVARGVWRPYGDGYVPITGDVAIYDGNGPFGQHTNFVMKLQGSTLTTIGGNENGKIHVQNHTLDDSLHVIGFASLASS